MRKIRLKKKIGHKVEGGGKVALRGQELDFFYFVDLVVNNQFEVEEVQNIWFEVYDKHGEDFPISIQENQIITELVEEMASKKAIEQLTISDFDDDCEQY